MNSSRSTSPLRRGVAAAVTTTSAVALLAASPSLPPRSPSSPAAPPLPIEVALSLRGHNGRSPINLSPDGEWLAHTIRSADRVERGASFAFADTGFSFAEGDARMEATLSNMHTGETILLGEHDASSWAPTWSPDGARVAYYSDAGGTAGLWIWDRGSRTARRVGEAIVRPFFGFEAPRWDADGKRLLVKLLPEGTELRAANALLSRPRPGAPDLPEPAGGEGPDVTVRRSRAASVPTAAEESTDGETPSAPSTDPLEPRRRGMAADLAILHLGSGRLERIVRNANVTLYAFSPDGTRVAYSADGGYDANAQQALFDMHVVELPSGEDRTVAATVPLRYGIEWSWSPDGNRLAWTRSGSSTEAADGTGRGVEVAALPTGDPRRLASELPHLSPGEGEIPPIWSADGSAIYGIGDGSLWRIDPGSGETSQAVAIDGWQLRHLVTASYASPVAWSTDGGETLWAFGGERDGERTGLFALRPRTGEAELRMADARARSGVFSLAASAAGAVVFAARSQQQPGELFRYDTGVGDGPGIADLDDLSVGRVTSINGALLQYALGEAHRLEFRSARDEPLAATLLLPPGHDGSMLPTVVWVYGGSNGSEALHTFGLWGSMAAFNMHVLASRGYAVLFPDAPVRTGHTTDDLEATVLRAVDAAVDAGIADPERLAVMGQSYGSLNTLALLTRTDRFDAAVISAAVLHPDLFADYLRDNTGYYETGQGDMGGTIWEFPDRYRDNSPLFDFDRIDTPLLIAQGKLDGDLVPSAAIFNALDRLEQHVEYRVYGGESHVITSPANVIDFWDRRLAFLAEHLRLAVREDGSVSIPQEEPGR